MRDDGQIPSVTNGSDEVVVVSLLASHQGDPGSIPGRVTPDFRKCKSCYTMSLVGGFSRGSPVSPALSFRCCPILISVILIGSHDLDVKSLRVRGQRLCQNTKAKTSVGHDGVMVRLLASRLGEPGSIPGGVAPRFLARGNRAGQCRWSGVDED
ncbi:hypothetical protein PR048_012152 [Dryococelus australis]|uniref:Uncharacterized protein n=1 Tax=Dryococelus australis TaxID=614101 RepID=A0ABQ9HNJ7_9NEOP|nr:hypothetical protein PR048_012152 [Dryococelus australis]